MAILLTLHTYLKDLWYLNGSYGISFIRFSGFGGRKPSEWSFWASVKKLVAARKLLFEFHLCLSFVFPQIARAEPIALSIVTTVWGEVVGMHTVRVVMGSYRAKLIEDQRVIYA